jgi:hypothetical protein
MTVGVVGARRDDGQPGSQAGEQSRVLESRAVVRDFQHVDTGQARYGAEQGSLGGGLQVAGEQHGDPLGADEEGDAGVVGAVVGQRRADGGRPQDLPVEAAEPAPLPRRRPDDRDAGGGGLTADVGGLVVRLVEGGGLDRAHRTAPQDSGQAVDVVGVEVGEHQERDGGDAEVAQAAVGEGGFRSGVDDHGGAGARREDQGVALADVAGDKTPVGRWPSGDGPGQGGRAEHREEQQERDGGGRPGAVGEAPGQQDGGDRERREEQGAGPGARPVDGGAGQGRALPGDGGDPAGGPAAGPGQGFGDGHGDGCGGQGREAEHGGRADGEFGEQVARDRDQAHMRRQHGHDGGAGRLGGAGGGQDLGEPWRNPSPPQGGAPARGDGEQSAGGQHGQREAVGAGEPRVVQDQQEHGGGQGGEQGAAAAGADGEQGDQTAGGGAQNAGVRAADDDEGDGEQPSEDGGEAQGYGEARGEAPALGVDGDAGRADQQHEDDRQVAAADGGEVGEVGGLESVVEFGGDAGGVADDEPREQGAGVGRQPVGRGPQARAEPPRGPLGRGGALRDVRRALRGQHGGEPVPGAGGRGEPGAYGQAGGGHQPQPGGGGPAGDQQDRGADGRGGAGHRQPVCLGLDDHGGGCPGRSPDLQADRAGVGGDRQLNGGVGAFGSEAGDRAAVQVGGMEPGDGGRGGPAQQGRRPGDRGGPPSAVYGQQDRRRAHGDGAGPGDRRGRHGQGDGRCEPCGEGGRQESQVGRGLLAGVRGSARGGGRGVDGCALPGPVPGRRPVRPVGRHGRTRVDRSANRRSPMPVTSRSWSTEVKAPCCAR